MCSASSSKSRLENEKLIYTVAGRFMITVDSTGF